MAKLHHRQHQKVDRYLHLQYLVLMEAGSHLLLLLFLSHHNHDFHHLTLYQLPFVPDVYETFLSLCEILIQCYKQIHTLIQQEGHTSMQAQQESYELLVKIDDKIKKQFISPTVKDIDSLSRSLLYEETTKLDSLLIQAK